MNQNSTSISSSRSVVVLAYGPEPWLDACLSAARADGGPDLEIVVVDNGCTRNDLGDLVARAGARLVHTETNLGFAGGCNFGAAATTGAELYFINSDAFVEPGCIAALARELADPAVGLASACIVLDDDPTTINSVGNPVHVSGLSWAGGYGEPVASHASSGPVASASGCVLAVRRTTWQQLDGFWGELFAYLEDTELSLRAWQRGLEVRYVADAHARHRYEFSRNALKYYLLERNRLAVIGTVYEARTLVRLFPLLAAFELLILALSVRQGWLREKVRGYVWLWKHRAVLRSRRALVQAGRTASDAATLGARLSPRIEPKNVPTPPGMGLFNAVCTVWCRLVLRPK